MIQASALLEKLNASQREAVSHPGGPLLVLAGAGSGKTRVLTHRAAYLLSQGASPFSILCITFTNKAAKEMVDRLQGLVGPASHDMWIMTFHAACARMLRRDAERIGYGRNFVILDSEDQRAVVKECLKELNCNEKRWPPGAVVAAISRAKDSLIGPEDYQRRARDPGSIQIAEIYKLYQKKLHMNNALDFGDLISFTVELLEGVPEVLSYYQDRFEHIMVDEYQDTNHGQYRLVKLLAAKHRNITVVGDADQGIYGWRGADISNILNFETDFPEARVIKLEENYRSTQAILDAASQVISRNRMRREKGLRAARGRGEKLKVYIGLDEREEAGFVADQINSLRLAGGRRWSDFAVLYRTHAQSRVFEDAFMKANITYTVVGGLKFYERKEIKDMLAYLRLVNNPRDRLAFQRVVNVPKRGIGPATLAVFFEYMDRSGMDLDAALSRVEEIPLLSPAQTRPLVRFRELLASFREQVGFLSLYELLQEIMDKTGYRAELVEENSIESLARVENMEELLSVAREFDRNHEDQALEAFLESTALVAEVDSFDDRKDAVTLMTLHSAKGLEFPVVFLVGMEEGIFPHIRALEDEPGIEEERRLCYVGMTRAMDRLFLSRTVQRTIYGQMREHPPSRFLDEFDPNLVEHAGWQGGSLKAFMAARRQEAECAPRKAVTGSFRAGEKVRHQMWGEGTVVSVHGEGEDAEIQVAFPARGVRNLLIRYAPIEKVGT